VPAGRLSFGKTQTELNLGVTCLFEKEGPPSPMRKKRVRVTLFAHDKTKEEKRSGKNTKANKTTNWLNLQEHVARGDPGTGKRARGQGKGREKKGGSYSSGCDVPRFAGGIKEEKREKTTIKERGKKRDPVIKKKKRATMTKKREELEKGVLRPSDRGRKGRRKGPHA